MNKKSFKEIVTFTRAGGAMWTNSAGTLIGVDFSSSTVANTAGLKQFVLSESFGADRGWKTDDAVIISQIGGSISLTGKITSYNATSQNLIVDVTSASGSGSASSWRIGSMEARLDYGYEGTTRVPKGILIEAPVTNLLLYSTQFNNAVWTDFGTPQITSNTHVAPTGSMTASTIYAPSSFDGKYQNIAVTASTLSYTWSVYVKKTTGGVSPTFGTHTGFNGGTSTSINLRVNTDTGAILSGTGGFVQNAGDYWRVSTTLANNGTNNNLFFGIIPSIAAHGTAFGPSGPGSAVIWGAQVEQNNYASSFIPTIAATATRSTDVVRVDTLSPWYNTSEGTLYIEGTSNQTTSLNLVAAAFSDGTSNNRIVIATGANNTVWNPFIITGGVGQGGGGSTVGANPKTVGKVACAYKVNDLRSAAGGVLGNAITTATIPTVDRLSVGSLNNTNVWNSHIRRVVYYPQRLTNTQLQLVTSI